MIEYYFMVTVEPYTYKRGIAINRSTYDAQDVFLISHRPKKKHFLLAQVRKSSVLVKLKNKCSKSRK